MKTFTDDEKITLYEACEEGKVLKHSQELAGVRDRQTAAREKRNENMTANMAAKKTALFKKADRRKSKYDTIVEENGKTAGPALKKIFAREALVQDKLAQLRLSWNGKKRVPNIESFALLDDLAGTLKQTFMENSGFYEIGVA